MIKNKEPKAKKPKKEGGGLGKFFLAIIMAIIVFIALLVIQSGILSNYEKTSVLVTTSNIAKGTDINESNYKDYFKSVDLDSKLVPKGAITDIEKVKDNVASQDIAEGEVVNKNALVSTDEFAKDIAGTDDTSDLVVSGFSASDLANSVCGILRRGDTIDITLIYEDEFNNIQQKVLENVYIKKSYDGDGNEIFAGDPGTATMFNFLLTKEEDDLLNNIISSNNGVVRIRKTNDPEF